MTAQLIDGNALSSSVLRAEVSPPEALKRTGLQAPGLGSSWSATNPPARSTCATRWLCSDTDRPGPATLERYAELTEAELLARIAALNADPGVHGILVQMPLPAHMNAQR